MIETTKQLADLMARAQKVDAVGLDTEFVWERTYFPRLGLVQLSLPQDECFLIDPLAIEDLSPLGDLLANKGIVKIFHDGPGDLALLRQTTGADPCNVFDTRLAAGFAGFPSTLSLLVLIENLLNITLNKGQTRSNWLNRPLSANQIKYGLEDVRYLRKIRRLLGEKVKPEIVGWLDEELRLFDSPLNYMGIADALRYTKVRGASGLSRRGLAVLRGLALWREEKARRRNKPRGHIIKDEVLVFIARREVVEPQALADCEGVSAKSIASYGGDIVDIVRRICAEPDNSYPASLRNGRPNKAEETALCKLQKFIAAKGAELGLDPALLGNKAELKAFIQKPEASSRQSEGWRKEFLTGFR